MGVIFPSAGGRLPHRLGPFPFIMGVILPSAGGHVALCWEGGGVADSVGGWGEGGAGGGGGIADLVGGGVAGGWGGMGWEGVVVWCGVSLSSHCLEPNHGFLAAIIHHISCIINPHHISG